MEPNNSSPWAERVLLPILLAFAAGVMVMDVARDYREMQGSAAFVATCARHASAE